MTGESFRSMEENATACGGMRKAAPRGGHPAWWTAKKLLLPRRLLLRWSWGCLPACPMVQFAVRRRLRYNVLAGFAGGAHWLSWREIAQMAHEVTMRL